MLDCGVRISSVLRYSLVVRLNPISAYLILRLSAISATYSIACTVSTTLTCQEFGFHVKPRSNWEKGMRTFDDDL